MAQHDETRVAAMLKDSEHTPARVKAKYCAAAMLVRTAIVVAYISFSKPLALAAGKRIGKRDV